MKDFWFGVAVGGGLLAVVAMLLVYKMHRRYLEALRDANARSDAYQRSKYEHEQEWQRRAQEWQRRTAQWDEYVSQLLRKSDRVHQGIVWALLPEHSAHRRD